MHIYKDLKHKINLFAYFIIFILHYKNYKRYIEGEMINNINKKRTQDNNTKSKGKLDVQPSDEVRVASRFHSRIAVFWTGHLCSCSERNDGTGLCKNRNGEASQVALLSHRDTLCCEAECDVVNRMLPMTAPGNDCLGRKLVSFFGMNYRIKELKS